jgi:hypothetical protein
MTRPRLAAYHLRECCAAAATRILREREARYPGLIEAGKLTAAGAAASLELARVIVAQWTWAMDPAGAIDPPWDAALGIHGFGAYNHDLVAELAGAARRARSIADRVGSQQATDFADMCDALHWWQDRDPGTYEARIVRDTGGDRRWAARMAREAAGQARAAA